MLLVASVSGCGDSGQRFGTCPARNVVGHVDSHVGPSHVFVQPEVEKASTSRRGNPKRGVAGEGVNLCAVRYSVRLGEERMRVLPFGLCVTVLCVVGCVDPDVGRDRDGDGFRTAELDGDDCDDANPNINPAASEQCGNGVDDNCDGIVDDAGVGQVDWYVDNDGDGFPSETVFESCSPPDGTFADLTQGVDCDDNNNTINPSAAEIYYDGIDQDCAGGDDNDADGDGHAALAEGGDDCDDTDALVSPSVDEVCNNGVDDDCDGGPGPCEYRGEVDVDEVAEFLLPHGVFEVEWVDVTDDGVLDLVTGATEFPGAIRIYDGTTLGNATAPLATSDPNDSSAFVNVTGDFNGDGLNDVVSWNSTGAHIYLMPPAASGTLQPDQVIRYREPGETENAQGIRHIAVVGSPTFDSTDSLAVFGAFADMDNESRIWMVSPSTSTTNLATAPSHGSDDVIGGAAFIPGDGTPAPMAIGTSLVSMTGIRRFWNVFGESPPFVLSTGPTEPVGIGMVGLPAVQRVDWAGESLDVFTSRILWGPSDSDIPAGVGVPVTGGLDLVRMPYLLRIPDTDAGETSPAVVGRQYCDLNLDGTIDILQTTAIPAQGGIGTLGFVDRRVAVYYDGADYAELDEADEGAHFTSTDMAEWSVQSCVSGQQPVIVNSIDRNVSVGIPKLGL